MSEDWAVFVINLDRSPDRLARISRQLDAARIPFQRFAGVDGGDINDKDDSHAGLVDTAHWGAFHHRNPLAAEIGCYLSHIGAMRAFLESKQTLALVLEDDAEIPAALSDLLDALRRERDQWDLVKLHATHPGPQPRRAQLTPDYSLTSYVTRSACSTAYCLSKPAAATLIDYLLPARLPFDHVFDRNFDHGLKTRGVAPMPIGTGRVASVINQDRDVPRPLTHGLGDRPLLPKWRTPFYRLWTESRRLIYNLFVDGGLRALLVNAFQNRPLA
ncbi:MAG: glycosyltransferase family 25 protein [Pseudomonadota bacterium]